MTVLGQAIQSAVRITSIGTYIPPRRDSNLDLLERFRITPEFLQNKIGVIERARKEPEEKTSDLCIRAFEDLLAVTAVVRSDVELVCVVTQNPDYKIPHTAAIVHQRLGMSKRCMTFDVSQGCAGYVHGLAIVDGLMKNLRIQRALLFTCDPYSQIINEKDRDTALLFGDAATVTLLTRDEEGYSFVDADFGTSPNSYSVLMCEEFFKMDGRGVFLNAARAVPESVRTLLARHQLSTDDIDEFLFHPGSKHMIDTLRRDLRVTESKLPFEAGTYGNAVSSSIPLMLKSRLADRAHTRLLLSGFGVGFSWGTCLVELTKKGQQHGHL